MVVVVVVEVVRWRILPRFRTRVLFDVLEECKALKNTLKFLKPPYDGSL